VLAVPLGQSEDETARRDSHSPTPAGAS